MGPSTLWNCLEAFPKLLNVLNRKPPPPRAPGAQSIPRMDAMPFVRLMTRFFSNPLAIFDHSLRDARLKKVSVPGMQDLVIVGDYALAKQLLQQTAKKLPVLRDKDLTRGGERQYGRENAFTADPEIHDRARAFIQRAFGHESVYRDEIIEDLSGAARNLVTRLRARANPHAAVEVTQDVNEATMHALLRGVLGYEPGPEEIQRDIWPSFAQVNNWILKDTLLARLRIDVRKLPAITPWQRRLKASHVTIDALIDKIIANARRPEAKDDFLFYHVARDPNVPEAYLRSTIKTTLAGALETSSSYINWTMHALGKNPDVARELREEVAAVVGQGPLRAEHVKKLEKLSAFIREVGRHYSPFYFIPRRASENFNIESRDYGKLKVTKGTHLLLSVFHANHDPTVWELPDEFDPMRFRTVDGKPRAPTPLTFGHGKYTCVGVHLAELDAVAFSVELLRGLDMQTPPGVGDKGLTSDLATHPRGGNWLGLGRREQ